MQIRRLIALTGACWCLSVSAFADTLTFIGQPTAGIIDDNWFNSINWFTTNSSGTLVPAGRVPLADEVAIITGTVDLQASGVRVQTLLATNNAAITNGTMAVENLQLLTGCSINGVNVNVLAGLIVGGTNCTLNATTLSLLSIASGSLQAIAPAPASSLVLTQGAVLIIGGSLSLSDGSQIRGGGVPQSELVIAQGAVLISTNSTGVIGSNGSHLIVDNSGTVRADGGTLTFSNGIDWRSGGGAGEFRAAGPASTIVFNRPFQVESNVISSFTGAGTNVWLLGGTIDGIAQISAIDPNTQLAEPGHLELLGVVSGAGMVHILGTTNQGGVGIWSSGTLELPNVKVDPGANLFIGGTIKSLCQLAGCTITNLGSCTFGGSDLDFSQGAAFDNAIGATVVAQSDGAFSSSAGGGIINNFGTFQKIGGGTTEFIITNSIEGPDFNNEGLLDIEAGQLNLLGGASSGEFHQTQGALLWFWGGTHSLNSGASFTGPGTVRLAEGNLPAKWLLNDSIVIPELEVGANGTVDSSGAPGTNVIQIGTLLTHENALITNGTFQINTFQMLDQSLVAAAGISIESALTVGGTNCTLAGTSLNLSSNASAILQASNGGTGVVLTLAEGSVLQDSGKITLTDGTSIAGGAAPPSKIVVQPGAVLVCTNSAVIQAAPNAPLIIDNNGTIGAIGGTLTLANGLSWQSSSELSQFQALFPTDQVLFTGPFQVSSGATSVFAGLGTNRWLQTAVVNGTAQIGSAISASQSSAAGNLEIGCAVSGTGFLHVIGGAAPAGTVSWTSGTVNTAHVDIDSGGILLIGGQLGTTRQLDGCALNNAGFCSLIGGDLTLANSAIINDQVGGTFDLQANVVLGLIPVGGSASINNAGTFLMSATGISVVSPAFANSGKLEIQKGTLAFQGAWNQMQGTTLIDSGATLGGTNLTVTGGVVSGTGTIAANLVNTGGTVSPGTGFGILSTDPGQSYQQGAAASLAFELGGTTPGSQFDQFIVGGTASLDGQLVVSFANGFLPQPGQAFQVLTAASVSGKFAQITTPSTAGTLVARYGSNNVTLVVVNNVTVGQPSISSGALSFSINTMPGLSYIVQATDRLNQPNWQTIRTIAGDGTTKTVSEALTQGNRFYRVVIE